MAGLFSLVWARRCDGWVLPQVLLELKEYASEVDVDFVRKAVRTIGRCAIKLEVAAERCIKVCAGLSEGREVLCGVLWCCVVL